MKFVVELAVGFCASLEVEADNKNEAVKIAKELVLVNPSDYLNEIEIEDCNFIQEIKEE